MINQTKLYRTLCFMTIAFFVAPSLIAKPEDTSIAQLCESEDKQAQRFCLQKLEKVKYPTDKQLDSLRKLAQKDTKIGGRAEQVLNRLEKRSKRKRQTESFGDPTRTVTTPTAFTQPKGKAIFQATQLGIYDISYGITDNLQISGGTNIPIGLLSLGGSLQYGHDTDFGAVSLTGFFRTFIPIGSSSGDALNTYGGGPQITIGNRESAMNLSLQYFGGSTVTSDIQTSGSLMASVGGFHKMSDSARFQGELLKPISLEGNDIPVAFLIWGFQLGSNEMWGDVGLINPIGEGMSGFYETIPLGIPYLGFGASW